MKTSGIEAIKIAEKAFGAPVNSAKLDVGPKSSKLTWFAGWHLCTMEYEFSPNHPLPSDLKYHRIDLRDLKEDDQPVDTEFLVYQETMRMDLNEFAAKHLQ